MRTITTAKRKCGRRKSNGIYLVSMPGDGELPLWVDIAPAIPFEGEHFRGCIYVDLETIMEGKPMAEYLVGESADRNRREIAAQTDLEAFGMPLAKRLKTGICKGAGIAALHNLTMKNVQMFGTALRLLSKSLNGKVQTEAPRAIRYAQDRRFDLVLATLWRIKKRMTPGDKDKVFIEAAVLSAMVAIGARADAEEM